MHVGTELPSFYITTNGDSNRRVEETDDNLGIGRAEEKVVLDFSFET
jgi:hypothetical protein